MYDEAQPHQVLAALAKRQHGVVSIGQLRQLGYSKDQIRWAVVTGRLHSLDRSVYAVGHTNLSLHGQCLAAVFACGPGAVLSHYSAAWLHGLARWKPEPFHVTGPVARRPRMPVHIHRTRRLADADWTLVEEIPVSAVPRLLLDLAACVKAKSLERLDCYWPEFRFAVELDVFETHGTRAAFERDRKRREDLLLAGITMTRVTGPRLEREPEEVIERVARLLRQRRPNAPAPYPVSSTPSDV